MRLAALVSSCVLLLSASGRSQAPSAAQPGANDAAAVSVGILREDTVLIPFAVYSNSSWTTPWPDMNTLAASKAANALLKRNRVPLSELPAEWWGASGPVRQWELLRASGDRSRIDALGSRPAPSHCTTVLGLATDYTSPVVFPRDTYPLPYAGIVSTRPSVLQPVVKLTRRDPEYQAVRRELPALFRQYGRTTDAAKRAASPPAAPGSLAPPQMIGVQVAFLPDGQRLLHFEAVRDLPSQEKTRLDGWFTRAPGASGLSVRHVSSTVSDADGKGSESFVPLAAIVLDGRVFWLGSTHSYEAEDYVVYDVTEPTPKMAARSVAGGC